MIIENREKYTIFIHVEQKQGYNKDLHKRISLPVSVSQA